MKREFITIFLPPTIPGLPGTGWEVKDGILYIGNGKKYQISPHTKIPPPDFVGEWEFELASFLDRWDRMSRKADEAKGIFEERGNHYM